MEVIGGNSAALLRSFVSRLERLNEEKRSIQTDITDLMKEAKDAGFDTKIIRLIVKERSMLPGERAEQEALLDTYRHALGMLADTPLGSAAMARASGGQIDIEDAIKDVQGAAEEEPQGVEDLAAGQDGSQDTGPLFRLLEAQPLEVYGKPVRAWRLLHKGVEVFAPVGDQQFVQECVDQLNDAVHAEGGDIAITDIRIIVRHIVAMYGDLGRPVTPVFSAPYDQDDEMPSRKLGAADKPKAARITDAEKVAAYFEGYDAPDGATLNDCPHKRGARKDEWQRGWADYKDGKAPSYVRPTPPAANDDDATDEAAA